MANSIQHALMNRGNSRERQLGRMLARGRTRGIDSLLQHAIDISEKVAKDFSGAGAPVTGDAVYTPTPNMPPRRKKASRLSIPHE